MHVPPVLQRKLYAFGTLASDADAFHFDLENQLGEATLTRVVRLGVDGTDVPLSQVQLELDGSDRRSAAEVAPEHPAALPLRHRTRVLASLGHELCVGLHRLTMAVETIPYGLLELDVSDAIAPPAGSPSTTHVLATPTAALPTRMPHDRDPARDYSPEHIAERQRYVAAMSGRTLDHATRYTADPQTLRGNIENFTGVAQVPLGFAGPLLVNGEHAKGEFVIPLATTEGSLVASYSRGMKVLNLSGGVTCTVNADAMQRAPVFGFAGAREARAFREWVAAHAEEIRVVAEATSHVAKLLSVEVYLASRFAYARFSYATGDAGGQNMVGKATLAASEWILKTYPGISDFYLESNLATDKKPSHINTLRNRGKNVTAEVTIPRGVLKEHLRVDPETLQHHGNIASVGAILAGLSNNGLHSANAITAMFIALGQDVANVTEASNAIVFGEVTKGGDFYISLTIPSLIVATHGGGTGLATQRECLEVLGCWGIGKARKLAEIVAGVALAGEVSLAAAISANEWVSAHERFGRKR